MVLFFALAAGVSFLRESGDNVLGFNWLTFFDVDRRSTAVGRFGFQQQGAWTQTRHPAVDEIGVGDALLSAVSDNSVDLLVMGAYGHSRIRELVLGGVTRDVLKTMTVPVLMSG